MKKASKALVPAATAIAIAATGCQTGPSKEKDMPPVVQEKAPADTLKEDTMSNFIERMQRWEALHGGASQSESDK